MDRCPVFCSGGEGLTFASKQNSCGPRDPWQLIDLSGQGHESGVSATIKSICGLEQAFSFQWGLISSFAVEFRRAQDY